MRYKVKAPSDEVLSEVEETLAGKARIYVVSRKRRSISTGDLTQELIRELEAEGALVAPDYQYEPDAPSEPPLP